MKKSIALILVLVLCLGIFAGCQQDTPEDTKAPETTAAPSGDTTAAPVDTTAAEPEEYTFPEGSTLWIISGHDINDLPLDKFIEDATGVDVKWTPKGKQDETNTMLTQKVTPSLIYHWGGHGGGLEWAHEMGRYGAFVNLWEYREIMPNFFKLFDSYGEQIKKEYMTSENELYVAPIWLNGDVERYAWYYREDIFAEHNLTPPTTWEEFLNICKVLKEAYPDSYPVTFREMQGSLWVFDEMAQQFGVDYHAQAPSLDTATGKYYNAYTTDESRNMLKRIRELIELGYMDVAALSNSTADWVADMSSGKSFITHDKAFQMTNLENAGKEVNEKFSLNWWHNLPLVESDLPYQTRSFKDYNYSWQISSKCEDVELAVRYLDWMYSEEGSLILSWGVEGESYGVDANGKKYFLEDYDPTYQARFQETGYIDFDATAASYSAKGQEMIYDTMKVAIEGDFWLAPSLVFTTDEQATLTAYMTDWYGVKDQYWQKFLIGDLDIDDDATWQKFKDDMVAYGEAEILAAYDAALVRYNAG